MQFSINLACVLTLWGQPYKYLAKPISTTYAPLHKFMESKHKSLYPISLICIFAHEAV